MSCVCVCVCERERERETESEQNILAGRDVGKLGWIQIIGDLEATIRV